jgi:hypothetical protein
MASRTTFAVFSQSVFLRSHFGGDEAIVAYHTLYCKWKAATLMVLRVHNLARSDFVALAVPEWPQHVHETGRLAELDDGVDC